VLFLERISITLQRSIYFDILVSWVEDIPNELTTLDSCLTLPTCFLYTASLSLPAAGKKTLVFCAISLAVASLQIELVFFLPAQLPIASQHLRKKKPVLNAGNTSFNFYCKQCVFSFHMCWSTTTVAVLYYSCHCCHISFEKKRQMTEIRKCT